MKKTAIITGASGNLGTACVKAFLKEDYKMIAIVGPNESIAVEGADLTVHEMDLTNEGAVNDFMEKEINKQTIDCALLLVGGFAMGNVHDTDSDQLQSMFNLNFFTAYHCARPIYKKMSEQENGGRIIMMGSKPAQNPKDGKNTVAYALSKSLLFNLADILNAESDKGKVVAHIIAPSVIDTPPNREAMSNANFDDWVTPESIAKNILWLCSESGSDIRGGVFKLYGGMKD